MLAEPLVAGQGAASWAQVGVQQREHDALVLLQQRTQPFAARRCALVAAIGRQRVQQNAGDLVRGEIVQHEGWREDEAPAGTH